jgi:hypothetical protein
MKVELITFTYFFSYWIFVWFIVYKLGWTKYNPYGWLVLGLVFDFFAFFLMLFYRNDFLNPFLFGLLQFFIKIIPIGVLWGSSIRWRDIYAGLGLLVIYLITMVVLGRLFSSRNPYYELLIAILKNRPFLHRNLLEDLLGL